MARWYFLKGPGCDVSDDEVKQVLEVEQDLV